MSSRAPLPLLVARYFFVVRFMGIYRHREGAFVTTRLARPRRNGRRSGAIDRNRAAYGLFYR